MPLTTLTTLTMPDEYCSARSRGLFLPRINERLTAKVRAAGRLRGDCQGKLSALIAGIVSGNSCLPSVPLLRPRDRPA
jgi:hypothetical protein